MIRNIFKVVAVVTSVILPSVSVAGGCVEDVDAVVTVRENGSTYHVDRVVDYIARITPKDLRNSKGVRLGSFAAVMQQDRANVHKGVTRGDLDGYFTSLKRRSELTGARYYVSCGRSAGGLERLQSDILTGQWAGGLWVVAFRHPAGGLGVYLSEVD